jgi:hypothetical protein
MAVAAASHASEPVRSMRSRQPRGGGAGARMAGLFDSRVASIVVSLQ